MDIIDALKKIESEEGKPTEETVLSELIEDGYLQGTSFLNSDGTYKGCRVTAFTVKGRLLLSDLRRQQYKRSFKYKALSALIFCAGVAVTVLGQILVELAK